MKTLKLSLNDLIHVLEAVKPWQEINVWVREIIVFQMEIMLFSIGYMGVRYQKMGTLEINVLAEKNASSRRNLFCYTLH